MAMSEIPKTDLLHYYRALKIMRDVVQESPELLNSKEHEIFLLAWTIINDTQIRKYDYDSE
jgi:hypothetical protein